MTDLVGSNPLLKEVNEAIELLKTAEKTYTETKQKIDTAKKDIEKAIEDCSKAAKSLEENAKSILDNGTEITKFTESVDKLTKELESAKTLSLSAPTDENKAKVAAV